ncbi:hypothetical protein J3F83DRAFT_137398 [Trichoderma novae-zelandiae]
MYVLVCRYFALCACLQALLVAVGRVQLQHCNEALTGDSSWDENSEAGFRINKKADAAVVCCYCQRTRYGGTVSKIPR